MSRFSRALSRADAGFTLLETLVALAILAAVAGVTAASLRGSPPSLQLDNAVAALTRDASTIRHRAVLTQSSLPLQITDCAGTEATLIFHPDGTASPAEICVQQAGLTRRLSVSPLTGRLIPQGTP